MVMRWRLIRSPALSGAWNMAIDEAMLLAHAAGLTPPTFRLYSWSPPAVSLGLLQPADVVNEPVCRQLGIDLVRRPSGGGAVLHQHEVTYAVVADGRLCPDGSSVLATYRWLARGLMEGLKLLGIDATLPESLWETKTPSRSLSFCFVRLTGADLEVGGRNWAAPLKPDAAFSCSNMAVSRCDWRTKYLPAYSVRFTLTLLPVWNSLQDAVSLPTNSQRRW